MKIVVVTGQTATGKTKLALKYAVELSGEIINFDSRQIYKHLDIVTGKDRPKTTKIWLYDIVDPKDYFSSFDFVKIAKPIIKNIINRKKIPIFVGGTYLYLKHLLYGTDIVGAPNWELRKKLDNKSIKELQDILKRDHKDIFNSLNHSDQLNPRRLMRKIEIMDSKNIKHAPGIFKSPKYQIEIIGIKYKNKNDLIKAIKKRVAKRLKEGAINEVKFLFEKGYSKKDPGLKTIGYQQILSYLKGNLTQEQMIDQWITREVQYAKRQLTFMKKDKNIRWIDI